MQLTSLAIFCGSKNGQTEAYTEQATRLGQLLARHNITLIYGGGKKGLMGCVADSALAAGGKVRGVIPKLLVEHEHQHDALTELVIVDDMHQRKRRLYELCDAAIILPGGFGTLDEMFEIITWNGLAIHDKPVFLLNTEGFYDHLLAHVKRMQDEGFLYKGIEQCLRVLHTPEDLLSFLSS